MLSKSLFTFSYFQTEKTSVVMNNKDPNSCIYIVGEDVLKLTALNEVTVRREEARDLAELNIYLDNILLYTTKVRIL